MSEYVTFSSKKSEAIVDRGDTFQRRWGSMEDGLW